MSDLDQEFPKGAGKPDPQDTVQIIVSEQMARIFEKRCLGKANTKSDTYLAGPLLFAEDDLPTYIIGVRDL